MSKVWRVKHIAGKNYIPYKIAAYFVYDLVPFIESKKLINLINVKHQEKGEIVDRIVDAFRIATYLVPGIKTLSKINVDVKHIYDINSHIFEH